MTVWNVVVVAILRSPLHRLMSGSTDLVRFMGRRSGRIITTPMQYVISEDGLVILVGHAQDKVWWRNFVEPRDLEVLVKRVWRPMTGHVVTEQESPDQSARLLTAYCNRFPRARRASPTTRDDQRASGYAVVLCVPRAR